MSDHTNRRIRRARALGRTYLCLYLIGDHSHRWFAQWPRSFRREVLGLKY